LKSNFDIKRTASSPDWEWWGVGVSDAESGSFDVSFDNVTEVYP